jgi:hypothetical protein
MLDPAVQEKTWELAASLVQNAPTAISIVMVETGIAAD